jgi:uncharacterized repeat protein (TIGR03806 family)
MPEPAKSEVTYDLSTLGKHKLSEYGFFREPLANLVPTDSIIPYALNSSLFTDYARKKRFIYVPTGRKIIKNDREALEFPVGTVLIKNFYYEDNQLAEGSGRIIETRLLIHETNGWKALPYVWNKEQTDAFLEITGANDELVLTGHGRFTYAVPTLSQCRSCHERSGKITPIGPNVRQLNRDHPYPEGEMNQLIKMKDMSWLEIEDIQPESAIADWSRPESGNLDERARAYLDINCGHCHRPDGPAKNSGLDLTVFTTDDHALGIYKAPVAAGRGSGGLQHDIVPGNPEASILLYRMKSNEAAIKMPEMGRSIIHKEGVALIAEWIAAMEH